MLLEDKFIVLEYDTSRVDPGPALALFQLENSTLVPRYHPNNHPCGQLDMGECEAVRQYLADRKVLEVYSLKEILPLPDVLFGLRLKLDSDFEWGLYRPLGLHFWQDFFAEAAIELKEFNTPENERK